MNSAEILLAALQAGKMINDMVREYQAGDLTDAELQDRWTALSLRVRQADQAWVDASK
jgi:hypothetical protein